MKRNEPSALRAVDLRDLEAVIAVIDSRAFRRAAEVLGVEPSAISRRIRALEDRLGVALFERKASGVYATNAGHRFASDARKIIADLHEALDGAGSAGRGESGLIRIGVVGRLGFSFLQQVLSIFRRNHAAVRVDLVEASSEAHVANVENSSVDIAFVIGDRQSRDVESSVVHYEAAFIALHCDDDRASQESLGVDQVCGDEILIAQYTQGRETRNFVSSTLGDCGHVAQITYKQVGLEALMLMVGLGLGVAFACEAEAKLAFPNVTFVPLRGVSLPVFALWRPRNDNPALRRFLSLAIRYSPGKIPTDAASQTPDPSP